MTEIEKAIELMKEIGFDAAGPLDAETIVLHEEVREMCAEGKCKAYGKNWTCPPACGDLDYCRSVIAKYSEGGRSVSARAAARSAEPAIIRIPAVSRRKPFLPWKGTECWSAKSVRKTIFLIITVRIQ